MLNNISVAVGIIGGIGALLFGFATYLRNKRIDGKKDGVVLTELGYIKSGIDDIKHKQERQDQRYIEVVARLTAVESAAKQAHKRLDIIEKTKGA